MYIHVFLHVHTCLCVCMNTHTWMYSHPDTQVCAHIYNMLCQGSQELCAQGVGGCADLGGCVCACVRPLTRTQALEQPILQLWISPCHPEKLWGVVEGVGPAHSQSPLKILDPPPLDIDGSCCLY